MSSWVLVGGIALILLGAVLFLCGFQAKNVKRVLTGIGVAITGFLSVLLGRSAKKIQQQEQEISQKTAQLKKAAEDVKEVEDVQKEIQEIRTSSDKPADVPPADAGDSAARLDRLNRL